MSFVQIAVAAYVGCFAAYLAAIYELQPAGTAPARSWVQWAIRFVIGILLAVILGLLVGFVAGLFHRVG